MKKYVCLLMCVVPILFTSCFFGGGRKKAVEIVKEMSISSITFDEATKATLRNRKIRANEPFFPDECDYYVDITGVMKKSYFDTDLFIGENLANYLPKEAWDDFVDRILWNIAGYKVTLRFMVDLASEQAVLVDFLIDDSSVGGMNMELYGRMFLSDRESFHNYFDSNMGQM